MTGRTKRLMLAAALALPALLVQNQATAQSGDRIQFEVGDYSMAMPAEQVQQQSLQNNRLTTTYQDNSSISVGIVPRAEFEERTAIPAAEYLKDLFGEEVPSSSILQVIRDRNSRDLKDKQIEQQDNLTYYILTYPDRRVVYVADDYQPEYYVMLETRNRPLEPMLSSFQGGKTGSSSITGDLGGR